MSGSAMGFVSQELVERAKRTDLLGLMDVGTLHRESGHEFSGPCPKCGGGDRLHVTAEWFFCRQCHTKRGDVIEYVRWRDGLSFGEAVGRLTGSMGSTERRVNATETKSKPKEQPRPATWQRDAQKLVDDAHARLLDPNQLDNPGAMYLLGRGLNYDAWQTFRLGFAQHYNRESGREEAAIVMPWYGKGGLSAVRFRFLQPVRELRLVALTGSEFSGVLFGRNGLLTAAEGRRTLILCEGEINAMSIWQTQHAAALDVLSVGSESAKLTLPMIEYAKRFGRVIVWMDKPERVRELMSYIPGAFGVSSPGGKDANDLLQVGALGAYLATARFQAAQSDEERQRLVYDVQDAMRRPSCYDEVTVRVVEKMRHGLADA